MLRASQHPSGKIVEPVTGEVFEWDELKKVRSTTRTPVLISGDLR